MKASRPFGDPVPLLLQHGQPIDFTSRDPHHAARPTPIEHRVGFNSNRAQYHPLSIRRSVSVGLRAYVGSLAVRRRVMTVGPGEHPARRRPPILRRSIWLLEDGAWRSGQNRASEHCSPIEGVPSPG